MKIGLLITCLADAMFPDVGRATVEVLERLGHTVAFPAEQSCCGQMHVNTGYQKVALPLVERYADVFASYDAVVAPSGSCVGSVRHQHGLVARRFGSPALEDAVSHVAAKTYELSELLVDVLGVTDVGAYFPHRVTYHPTCHSLRMLRVGDKPLRLLAAVDGLQLVDLADADQCCGFGGTFALKNADTSTAMLTDKMRHVLDTGAQFCSAGDSSCLMHIGGGLSRVRSGVGTVHLAQILAATRERPYVVDQAHAAAPVGWTGEILPSGGARVRASQGRRGRDTGRISTEENAARCVPGRRETARDSSSGPPEGRA